MNDATAIGIHWFSGQKGTVGIAKVKTEDGGIEYRIGAVDGLLQKMDVIQVVAWGCRFPDAAGKKLFGDPDEKGT